MRMRQKWVDIAKGMAIIAVVMGHIGYAWPQIPFLPLNVLLVWLWHVPVFFMLGGFFLSDDKLVHIVPFVKRKIKTLYLPLLYVYVPVLLLHNVFIRVGFYDTSVSYSGKFVEWWEPTDFLTHGVKSILLVGQEPLLGAMWFVFVLLWALCLLAALSWLLKKICGKCDQRTFELVRCLAILTLAVLSWSLTTFFGFTKLFLNVTLVALWLIYVGMILMRRVGLQFNNGIMTLICILIAWHAANSVGGVNLVVNQFHDVMTLTLSSCSCLYVVCYLAKMIERHCAVLTSLLSAIGRDSFYIMGIHFVGFKIGTLVLNSFGGRVPLAELVPPVGESAVLFLYYLMFGVGLPVLALIILRQLKGVTGKIRENNP